MDHVKAKMASHLEELMGNAELYGWERVRAFHGVWLNQLEQGWPTWEEGEEKIPACPRLAPGHFSFSSTLDFSGIKYQEAAKVGFCLQCTCQAWHKGLQVLQ